MSTHAEVVARIHQDQRGDYAAAARVLERRGDDVVVIQHEYGIFGGHEGAYILSLAEGLRQPMVLTLHTVLSAPSVRQAETLRALCGLATLVCVFTETARRMILAARLAPPERVRVVPHGGPSELLRSARSQRREDRPPGARDLRPDLAGQGDRDRDRGHAGDRGATPDGALRDRRPDPPRGGQAPRRGVPDLARRLARDLGLASTSSSTTASSVDDLSAMLADTTIYLTPYRSASRSSRGR